LFGPGPYPIFDTVISHSVVPGTNATVLGRTGTPTTGAAIVVATSEDNPTSVTTNAAETPGITTGSSHVMRKAPMTTPRNTQNHG